MVYLKQQQGEHAGVMRGGTSVMRHRFAVVGLAFALALALLPDRSSAQPARRSLYDRTLAGTVMVTRPKDMGTGWVVDRTERLAVTNYHVVRDEAAVTVHFPQ